MAKVNYIVRDLPAGAPIVGATVAVETPAGATIDTLMTDSDGIATYEADGSPGPILGEATVSGRTMRRDGRSQDQMGTWYPYDAPGIFRALGKGVVAAYADPEIVVGTNMAVTPGTGLQVLVGTGQIILDGHRYRCTASTALAIGANASGSTRIDRVVARFTREGQTAEGKFELVVIAGTTSAPALTNTTATQEFSLAAVTVINGASSFTSGDITDERYSTTLGQYYFPAFPLVRQSGDLFYVHTDGKVTRLPKGTDGQRLTLASGIPSWATDSSGIALENNNTPVVTSAATLNFSSTFLVTDDGGGQGSVGVVNGGITDTYVGAGVSAAKIADGTVSNTEFQYLNGVTSAVQTQFTGKSATTHTHEAHPQLADSGINDYYSPIAITSAGQDVASVSLTLLNGVTYDCIADADMQAGGPTTTGTWTQAFALIASGSSTEGTKVGTVGGERNISARQTKVVVGTGVAVTFKARANTNGGTGTVNGAIVRATATPRNIPAS